MFCSSRDFVPKRRLDRQWRMRNHFPTLSARATIACHTLVFVARAKMTQVTSRSNKNHFSTWKASNLFGRSNKNHFSTWKASNLFDICSYSFKLRSNMYLSLGVEKIWEKSLINIRQKSSKINYSCFLARDKWRHMSARLNKGHTQFNSRPRL